MSLQLIGTNQVNSTLLAYDGSAQQVNLYSAFGNSNNKQNGQLPGFNGERPDPFTGVTHLGNGYRAYNPVLMRFTSPDSESPFGVGGINPYAYCENDPVNFTDPSGHGIFGLLVRGLTFVLKFVFEEVTAEAVAVGVAKTTKYALTYGTSITSKLTSISSTLVEDNNPQAAAKLSRASHALGFINTLTSLYSKIDSLYKGVKSLKPKKKNSDAENTLPESFTPLDEFGQERMSRNRLSEGANTNELSDRAESATQRGLRLLREDEGPLPERHEPFVRSNLSDTPVYQIAVGSLGIASGVFKMAGAVEERKGNDTAAMALNITSAAFGINKYALSVPKYVGYVKSAARWATDKIYSDDIELKSYTNDWIKLTGFTVDSTDV